MPGICARLTGSEPDLAVRVTRMLETMRREIVVAMALSGVTRIADVDHRLLVDRAAGARMHT